MNINNNINMFLNIKKFPLHQREMFPLPVGNYREISAKKALQYKYYL